MEVSRSATCITHQSEEVRKLACCISGWRRFNDVTQCSPSLALHGGESPQISSLTSPYVRLDIHEQKVFFFFFQAFLSLRSVAAFFQALD